MVLFSTILVSSSVWHSLVINLDMQADANVVDLQLPFFVKTVLQIQLKSLASMVGPAQTLCHHSN